MNRRQIVSVDFTAPLELTTRVLVPHGAPLAPYLFVYFIFGGTNWLSGSHELLSFRSRDGVNDR